MSWPDGRYIQASVFFSRWLLAPFLLGLLLCLLLLIYRFFGDLFELTLQVRGMNWHDLVTDVLNLVDLALTANLVIIVIFSSYENFIRRIDASAHPDWPAGPHPSRLRRAQAEAARLDRRHRRGRRAGVVFRPGKRAGHLEADLGARLPRHLRRRHVAVGSGRLAHLRPKERGGVSWDASGCYRR